MTHILISRLLLVAIAVTTVTADEMPPFHITTRRDNDRVQVKPEKCKTFFEGNPRSITVNWIDVYRN